MKKSKILQVVRKQQLNHDIDQDKCNLTEEQYNLLLIVRKIL